MPQNDILLKSTANIHNFSSSQVLCIFYCCVCSCLVRVLAKSVIFCPSSCSWTQWRPTHTHTQKTRVHSKSICHAFLVYCVSNTFVWISAQIKSCSWRRKKRRTFLTSIEWPRSSHQNYSKKKETFEKQRMHARLHLVIYDLHRSRYNSLIVYHRYVASGRSCENWWTSTRAWTPPIIQSIRTVNIFRTKANQNMNRTANIA